MKQKGRAMELLKTICVFFLLLLLLVQFLTFWMMGVNASDLPVDSAARHIYAYFNRGAVGYDVRVSAVSAVEPVQIAVATSDSVMALQYNKADISVSVNQLQRVFDDVMTSAKSFAPMEEAAYAARLENGNVIVLQYFEEMPLSAIASGLQTTSSAAQSAVSVTLFADDTLLVLRDKTGALAMASVSLDRAAFDMVLQNFRGPRCTFAGDRALVTAESLLFAQETLRFPMLEKQVVNPLDASSDASLKTLLEAFSYTSTANFYTEQNETVYGYADKFSTLRITGEGDVVFRASNTQSTILAFEPGEVKDAAAVLSAQISTAYNIASTALDAIGADAQALLSSVMQSEDGLTRLSFMQSYDGVPVVDETPFATFVFAEQTLSAADVRLELLLPVYEQEETVVFPASLAASTATKENQRMVIAYTKTQTGYTAQRYFID